MDVQRVLGECARADFEHHSRKLAGRVVVLLHRVNDSLAGGEIDGAATGDGEGSGATLGGVFAFAFDGDFLLAPDVQFALCKGTLVNLAPFSRRCDRVKDTTSSDARLDVLRHELIAVARDRHAGIFWHGS